MDPEEVAGSEVDAQVSAPEEQATASESSGNPAWESLRSKLDPISFHAIEEDLKAFDTATQKRIESVNEQYKPWKGFAEKNVTPEKISQSLSIAQQIEDSPEIVYDFLGRYLQQTGRMPSAQEVQAEVDSKQEADPQEDPASSDPRDVELQQLREQLSGVQQYIQQQAEVQQQQQLDAELDSEITSFQSAHPDLGPEDMREVLMRTALIAQEKGQATLDEGFANLSAYRERLLSTPRPGASAPTLIPTSGGVPAAPAGAQRTLGQLTNQETQNLFASLISKDNGKS